MITTIDKAGRLVVPKQLREVMGLLPGVKVDLSIVDGRIAIALAPPEVEIRTEAGFPVIHLSTDEESSDLTDEQLRQTIESVRGSADERYL